jgi:hypothetical protein
MRDELLVKLQAFDGGDGEAIVAALEERLERSRGKLALYERLRARMLDGEQEAEHLGSAERIGPFVTLAAGRAFERAAIDWAEWALAAISARARAGAAAGGTRRAG